MKVLFSGFRDPNHSSSGGYDKITQMGIEKGIVFLENLPFGKNLKSKKIKIAKIIAEIITLIKRRNFDVTHFIYGDITISHYIPIFKSKKHKLVATLHMDFSQKATWKKFFIKNLKKFNGIIVLSSQQEKLLKEQYHINAKFIPHGFTNPQFQFCIPKSINGLTPNKNKINISLIGSNYRDFSTFDRIIKEDIKDIHFHLVGVPKEIIKKYINYDNVSIYPRLNNDKYYSLIKIVDYNFLPVTFATANNTLLEAQALGTTSILPNIDGILDYAHPENIFYDNFDSLKWIFGNLYKTSKNQNLSHYINNNFSWEKINKSIIKYYTEI